MRQTIWLIVFAGALFCAPVVLSSGAGAGAGAAQAQSFGASAPFRILDQDRLLSESILGQQLQARLRAAERALEAENAALIRLLAAEERELTDLRPTLSPEDFRARADTFDARVEDIRAERERLSQSLARQYEADVQAFFATALPVLDRLMSDDGLIALLHPDVLIIGVEWLDITDRAIARLDASLEQPPGSPTPQGPEPPTDQAPDQSPQDPLDPAPADPE